MHSSPDGTKHRHICVKINTFLLIKHCVSNCVLIPSPWPESQISLLTYVLSCHAFVRKLMFDAWSELHWNVHCTWTSSNIKQNYGFRVLAALCSVKRVGTKTMTWYFRFQDRWHHCHSWVLTKCEGAPGPPEAIDVWDDDGGGPCAVSDGAEAAVMVKSWLTAFWQPKAYLRM